MAGALKAVEIGVGKTRVLALAVRGGLEIATVRASIVQNPGAFEVAVIDGVEDEPVRVEVTCTAPGRGRLQVIADGKVEGGYLVCEGGLVLDGVLENPSEVLFMDLGEVERAAAPLTGAQGSLDGAAGAGTGGEQ